MHRPEPRSILSKLDDPDVFWIPRKIYAEIVQRFDVEQWNTTPETYTGEVEKEQKRYFKSITKTRFESIYGAGTRVYLIIDREMGNKHFVHVIPPNPDLEQIIPREFTGDTPPVQRA